MSSSSDEKTSDTEEELSKDVGKLSLITFPKKNSKGYSTEKPRAIPPVGVFKEFSSAAEKRIKEHCNNLHLHQYTVGGYAELLVGSGYTMANFEEMSKVSKVINFQFPSYL